MTDRRSGRMQDYGAMVSQNSLLRHRFGTHVYGFHIQRVQIAQLMISSSSAASRVSFFLSFLGVERNSASSHFNSKLSWAKRRLSFMNQHERLATNEFEEKKVTIPFAIVIRQQKRWSQASEATSRYLRLCQEPCQE